MTTIDEALLDEKLALLERAREWSPRTIAKFEALLQSADETAVLRMNPLAFARDKAVAASEALDLFLHAARVGLVTMDWHLLCPACGAAVQSFASLRVLHRGFFCAMCELHAEANLDDFIQVSFTIAPAVRRLRYHDVETLSAEDFVFGLRLTREMHLGSLDGPRLCDILREGITVLTWVAPGQRVPFAFEAADPGQFSACEFQAHTGVSCAVRDEAATRAIDFEIAETAILATCAAVRPGRIEGHVTNQRSYPVVFALAYKPAAMLDGGMPVTVLEPMVTGAMLLTNQTFRRLFRAETVTDAEGIGVRDVTVLFTDLKSSTALYERIGDLKAFSLVQQHFDRLAAVIQANAGAIVKTIGDAVMAAFQRPVDAVRAALEMQAQIDAFNREHGERNVVLKIGIHRGPSIAVTLNDSLDYFGHTVNVAARVQGLADADEIFVTDDVYRADGVSALLSRVESHDAQLRGIQKHVRVHKAARDQPSS
jgi:class 3 adenylate cyclase